MTTEPLQSQSPQALPSAQQPQSHALSDLQLLTPVQMASSYPIAALAGNTDRAVSALQRGQVIAIPTDTLYGLATDANSSSGIQQIYSIKQRQMVAPLAICIADVADLHRYCHAEHLPEQLLQQLLPGPITLILRRRQDAPLCPELNPGLHTIGEINEIKLFTALLCDVLLSAFIAMSMTHKALDDLQASPSRRRDPTACRLHAAVSVHCDCHMSGICVMSSYQFQYGMLLPSCAIHNVSQTQDGQCKSHCAVCI